MDIKKAGQLLDRINALHKSLTLVDEDEMSAIERDLMLSYLRRLYDLYHHGTADTVPTKPVVTTPMPAPAPAPPVVQPQPEAVLPPPPVVQVTPPPVVTPPPAPAPPVVQTPPPAPVVTPPPPPTPVPASKSIPAKIAKLFSQPEARELSERLSRQPIKDLTRALTINDRVQFANVLFGGNADLMNSVLKRLNDFNDLDEAKPDLVDLADQFNWGEGESVEVAQNFIKLISRRYV